MFLIYLITFFFSLTNFKNPDFKMRQTENFYDQKTILKIYSENMKPRNTELGFGAERAHTYSAKKKGTMTFGGVEQRERFILHRMREGGEREKKVMYLSVYMCKNIYAVDLYGK